MVLGSVGSTRAALRPRSCAEAVLDDGRERGDRQIRAPPVLDLVHVLDREAGSLADLRLRQTLSKPQRTHSLTDSSGHIVRHAADCRSRSSIKKSTIRLC
jgi:hypothetical protein